MILLDSDILVDFFRGHAASGAWIQSLNAAHIAIPGFVALEMYAGCRNKAEQLHVQSVIQAYTILWPTTTVCDNMVSLYAVVHLSNALGILDALIAATALSHNTPLHTFNQKHFAAVPNLQTIQPYVR